MHDNYFEFFIRWGRHSLIFSLVCEIAVLFCVPVLLRFFGFCRGIWSSDRLELEVFLFSSRWRFSAYLSFSFSPVCLTWTDSRYVSLHFQPLPPLSGVFENTVPFILFCASRVAGALLLQVSPVLPRGTEWVTGSTTAGREVEEKCASPAGDSHVRCCEACGLCCCGEGVGTAVRAPQWLEEWRPLVPLIPLPSWLWLWAPSLRSEGQHGKHCFLWFWLLCVFKYTCL